MALVLVRGFLVGIIGPIVGVVVVPMLYFESFMTYESNYQQLLNRDLPSHLASYGLLIALYVSIIVILVWVAKEKPMSASTVLSLLAGSLVATALLAVSVFTSILPDTNTLLASISVFTFVILFFVTLVSLMKERFKRHTPLEP